MTKARKLSEKRFIKLILVILILVVIVAGFIFMSKNKKVRSDIAKERYPKVLIIGIDAMDPKITKELMENGLLKNFKKLSQSGTFTNLNTTYPPETPVAWTSVATGNNPGKHDIFDFIQRDTRTYMPELSITRLKQTAFGPKYYSSVKSIPFWEITSKNGIPTTIIRWPVTFPPTTVKGNMLSGLGVPDIKGFLSGYTIYTDKIITVPDKTTNKYVSVKEKNGTIETYISGPNTKKGDGFIDVKTPMTITIRNMSSAFITVNGVIYNVKEKEWTDWIKVEFNIGLFDKVSGIAKAYVVSISPFKLYLTTINMDPERPIADITYPNSYSKTLAKKIGSYATLGMPEETEGYVDGNLDKDAFLQFIESLEKEKEEIFWKGFLEFNESRTGVYAFVFDASDRLQHVMTEKGKSLSDTKAISDYYSKKDEFLGEVLDKISDDTLLLIVSDHGFSTYEKSVSVNNWLHENGYLALKGESNDMGEQALFQNVDWSKTKAYSLGFTSIFINLKERESQGIVSIEEKDKLVFDLKSKLKDLKDDNGKKVFHDIYRREDVYDGKYTVNAPDLILGFNPGFRMSAENAIGGFAKKVITLNDKKWAGDHLIDPVFVPGVLFSNFNFNVTSASNLDIAPTILASLGIIADEKMDGKSMFR